MYVVYVCPSSTSNRSSVIICILDYVMTIDNYISATMLAKPFQILDRTMLTINGTKIISLLVGYEALIQFEVTIIHVKSSGTTVLLVLRSFLIKMYFKQCKTLCIEINEEEYLVNKHQIYFQEFLLKPLFRTFWTTFKAYYFFYLWNSLILLKVKIVTRIEMKSCRVLRKKKIF